MGGEAAAMPPSWEVIHADEDETTPLVGVAQGAPEAEAPPDAAVPPAPFPWWRRLPFLGPTDCFAVVGQTMYRKLYESIIPEHLKQLASDRQFATFCLNHYNSSHLDKYEPAPGKVTTHYFFYHGRCLCHGNFVARRKCSGWLSFLQPAPRTLFFFEISGIGHSREVVTICTPLDEPVTEAYSVLGFPLGCSKRRSGKSDTNCRTCTHHFYLPHPGIQTKPQCEHDDTRKVCEICLYRCEMCDNRPIVLHPDHVHLLSES